MLKIHSAMQRGCVSLSGITCSNGHHIQHACVSPSAKTSEADILMFQEFGEMLEHGLRGFISLLSWQREQV